MNNETQNNLTDLELVEIEKSTASQITGGGWLKEFTDAVVSFAEKVNYTVRDYLDNERLDGSAPHIN